MIPLELTTLMKWNNSLSDTNTKYYSKRKKKGLDIPASVKEVDLVVVVQMRQGNQAQALLKFYSCIKPLHKENTRPTGFPAKFYIHPMTHPQLL